MKKRKPKQKFRISRLLEIKQLYFMLPDKFEGSVADAFRLVADHIETPSKNARKKTDPVYCSHNMWGLFTRDIPKGVKLISLHKLLKLNKKTNKWEKLHKNADFGVKYKKTRKSKK